MVMEGRFNKFINDQDIGHDNSPENSGDSPPSSILNDTKTTCISSPKRSRRAVQKRVVSVPIRDVEGSRLKGETNAPPSDSWAWRKYGQKPIKGSPYPRGYYRCSSSKGCPARKQVERSRSDPTMVIVTYSSDHNHPWPASNSSSSRTHHNHHHSAAAAATTTTSLTTNSADDDTVQPAATAAEPSPSSTPTFPLKSDDDHHDGVSGGGGKDLGAISFLTTDQHYQYAEWFSDLDQSTAATTLLESPLMAAGECGVGDADMAMVFSIDREGDESFFADLGELPECTAVFRRRVMMEEEEHRRCNLAPWCGTT